MILSQRYSKFDFFIFYMAIIGFKIFGLAPFFVNISKNPKSKKKQYIIKINQSIKGAIYNLLLIILILFIFYHFDVYLRKRECTEITKIQNLYENVLAFVVNSICVIIIFVYGLKQRVLVMTIKRLINLEIELEKHIWNYCKFKSARYKQVLVFIVYFFINMELGVTEAYEEFSGMVNIMVLELPEIIIEGILIQFSLILISLKTKFYNLNKSLSLMEHDEMEQEIKKSKIYFIKVLSNSFFDTDFYFIKKSHRILYEISVEFLQFYSWMMMCSITILCIELIDDSYYFIEFMMYKQTPLTVLEVVRLLGWVIKNLFPIAVLTSSVTSITSEMTKTSKIVCKLMSSSMTHPQVKYEMEQFLIELLHRDMEFTACGLFPIDGSLLTSIISTTITYLIIFLQFKRSHRGMKSNNQLSTYQTNAILNTTQFYAFNFTDLYDDYNNSSTDSYISQM